jgi:hypothetical protein
MVVFMVIRVVALITLIIPWYFLSHYLAAPVISVEGQLMDSTFLWVDGFDRYEIEGTLLTTLNVAVT